MIVRYIDSPPVGSGGTGGKTAIDGEGVAVMAVLGGIVGVVVADNAEARGKELSLCGEVSTTSFSDRTSFVDWVCASVESNGIEAVCGIAVTGTGTSVGVSCGTCASEMGRGVSELVLKVSLVI